MRKRFSSR